MLLYTAGVLGERPQRLHVIALEKDAIKIIKSLLSLSTGQSTTIQY